MISSVKFFRLLVLLFAITVPIIAVPTDRLHIRASSAPARSRVVVALSEPDKIFALEREYLAARKIIECVLERAFSWLALLKIIVEARENQVLREMVLLEGQWLLSAEERAFLQRCSWSELVNKVEEKMLELEKKAHDFAGIYYRVERRFYQAQRGADWS
jgi:hypothetical protein